MKNDLQELNLDKSEQDKQSVTLNDKIRNSTYYIVSRSIKFGHDTKYLLQECNLVPNIIKDLTLQNTEGNNNFVFQNLISVIGNLKHQLPAIMDLVGNNYEIIFEEIRKTQDKTRRTTLLKVVINLIIEASEQLSHNPQLF